MAGTRNAIPTGPKNSEALPVLAKPSDKKYNESVRKLTSRIERTDVGGHPGENGSMVLKLKVVAVCAAKPAISHLCLALHSDFNLVFHCELLLMFYTEVLAAPLSPLGSTRILSCVRQPQAVLPVSRAVNGCVNLFLWDEFWKSLEDAFRFNTHICKVSVCSSR